METRNLIDFVPAASATGYSQHNDEPQPSQGGPNQGHEVRKFYEELLGTQFNNAIVDKTTMSNNTGKDKRCKRQRRKCEQSLGHLHQKSEAAIVDLTAVENQEIKSEPKDVEDEVHSDVEGKGEILEDISRKQFMLLNYSQNGNLEALVKLLKDRRVDIDYQDQYGWTALMCAGVARHVHIVKVLIKKGANTSIRNNNRQTVSDMCAGLFEEMRLVELKAQLEKEAKLKDNEPFHCEVCNTEIKETSFKEHIASTIHLFNTGHKPKPDTFMISESNVGFQLMQKSGWDGQSGLGTSGHGQKYPVKTTLKRDRKCLGTEEAKKKPKVTHFGPNDTNAVQSIHKNLDRVLTARTVSKRERKRKVQKAKKWERDLRTYMNLD